MNTLCERDEAKSFLFQKYSTEIRCMALEVFSHVVMSLSHCGFNELFKHRLRPAVSLFCKTSTTSWKSVYSDDKLKTNILKVVVALIKHSPKYVGDYLANLLPLFWQTFIDSAEKYRANIVESVRTKRTSRLYSGDDSFTISCYFLFSS